MKKSLTIFDMTEAFQRGEEKGFNFYYNTYYPALLYYAYRMLNDKDEAKDQVDIAYIKIWERRESFNYHKVIKSWLYTTVRNQCLNLLQNDLRKKDFLKNIEIDNEQDHVHNMILAERANEVATYLDCLPKACREIITMYYYEGKNTSEIASELDLSPSTVKNQKVRGLELIRKLLKVSKEVYNENQKKLLANLRKSIDRRGLAGTAHLYNLDPVSLQYLYYNPNCKTIRAK